MATILVVEDDKLLGRELNETLVDGGYTTFWAKTGREALETLRSQEISLVYLDIMLAGDMDGYEVLQEIKKTDGWKGIDVVMLSNLGQLSEVERAMELGAADYIVKATIDLDKLLELTKTKYLRQ